MNTFISAALLIPLFGFVAIFLTPHYEKKLANISLWLSRILGLNLAGLFYAWSQTNWENHEYEWFTFYPSDEYRFPVLLYFDAVSAVYWACV